MLCDLQRIISQAALLGLKVHPSKCELIFLGNPDQETRGKIHAAFDDICPGINIIPKSELCILSAGIGEDAIRTTLTQKSENLQKLQGTLKSLDSHVALFLLKNCFSIPKLTYFLRCSPTFTQPDLFKRYDDIIASMLCDISNLQFNELSLDQASLPAHLGGIGISKATTLEFPAFLASASSCRNLSSQILWDTDIDEETFNVAFALWSESTGIVAAPEKPCYQERWSLPLYEASRDALISKLDDPGKRRITSFQGKRAAARLSALPSMNLGLKLTHAQLKNSIGSRLGLQLCETHTCVCGSLVEKSGKHGLSCRRSAGRFSRHTALNAIVKCALGSVHIPATLEPPGLLRSDNKRPDGMSLLSWSRGQSVVWDVTVVDALAPSRISNFAPGNAAEEAESRKRSNNTEVIQAGYNFIPLAFEAQGQPGPDCNNFIKELGKRLIVATKEPRAAMFLKQRISIAIQTANSACILGTIREVDSLEELFYTI